MSAEAIMRRAAGMLNWDQYAPEERSALLMLRFERGVERSVWGAVARQIREANKWVLYARARGSRTADGAIRLHYCEAWLASLLTIARALP